MGRKLAFRISCALLLSASIGATARAQTWPPDFVTEDISGGWTQPTCICFAGPDDLLVTEKQGLLWEVRSGIKAIAPVIDLRQEALNNGDRGLLSVQIDPDFVTNHNLYLLYVVDPNQDGADVEQESFGRLTRYTTYVDVNGDLKADLTSRKVLIGADWTHGFPSLHLSHSTGDMRFATDGSLFVSFGDGAHYDLTDVGGNDPNGFGPGKFDASEDMGAFRSQSITSLAGKILRIDPDTGLGLPDNPFWTGNGDDHASRVWNLGLRNPFRFTMKPGTGPTERLIISDVGWNTWEELNSSYGGENFGWPCWEGPRVQSSYDAADPFGDCNDPTIFTKPLWTWNHSDSRFAGFTGQCATGVCYYEGDLYPQDYKDKLFFSDYSSNWIRTVKFVAGQPTDVTLFGDQIGNPVDLISDPVNGDLLYIAIGDNAIRRIRYTKANHPPVAVATATPTWGASPLTVSFDATQSYDPEGAPLAYLWDFGDGTTDTTANPTHVFAQSLNYAVALTLTDVGGETAVWNTTISVDNSPPQITSVISPINGQFYHGGDVITLDATASDAEDDPAGIPLTATWVVDLIHDHHTHPGWATISGFQGSYQTENHGPGTYLHVTLTVTDSRGLTDSRAFDLFDLDNKPAPHIWNVSNYSPRLGLPVVVTGHLHYPGLGNAKLVFDWGDGSTDVFFTVHMQDVQPSHTYAGPGLYTFRLTATDGASPSTVTQPILVRSLLPAVAVFAPTTVEHWMTSSEQQAVASGLVSDLRAQGFEAQQFNSSTEDSLRDWLNSYLYDSVRDYLVCLDSGSSTVYAGEDDGSLAETWLDAGNGIVWTGFTPFARYVLPDGTDSYSGAGAYAADEVLDSSGNGIVWGSGHQYLLPPATDLPDLAEYDAVRGVQESLLGAGWSIDTMYASDGNTPAQTDAVVLRNTAGGEYAQFYVIPSPPPRRPQFPREAVIREFLLSHLYKGLPSGPSQPALLLPLDHMQGVPVDTKFAWKPAAGATSYLFELATDRDFTQPVSVQTINNATSASLATTLAPNTRYCWRVTARNDYGSQTSAIDTFVTTSKKLGGKKA